MQKLFLPLLFSLFFFSCKKSETTSVPDSISGQWSWVIQRENNPAYFSTPATTGIQETLEFNNNGAYTIKQNSIVVNSGTYKTVVVSSIRDGNPVPGILYTNARVRDSAAYYQVISTSDSLTLVFCNDLIGTLGSSSRFYGRQK